MHDVGDTWDVGISLLDDGESEDGEIHGDDATTNRLALAFTSAAWTVARVSIREQKADTGWVHNTLLHRETLLVVASGDLEDIALELIADRVSWNLLAHAIHKSASLPFIVFEVRGGYLWELFVPLVHEDTELLLIFDLDELLTAVGREGDVQLHDC